MNYRHRPTREDLKVGDMVKAAYFRSGQAGIHHEGIVIDIETSRDLFSDKYSIMETNTYIRVLSSGNIMTFDLEEDVIEVISESR